MFDNVINLNKYLKPKIREEFGLIGGGDSTSISDSTNVTKNFENNQKINRSMMVESITKLVNNIASDVVQKNSSNAASAAGASNSLWLSGVQCDEVTITGIRQGAAATNQTLVKSAQSNMSTIANEITTTIDKTIEKIGSTDLAALQAENTKQLDDFMNAMPGYDPNKAQKLASKCPDDTVSLISASNTCNVSTSYELDASVKQSLDLDESFTINDQDDIANDIKTKLEQSNFASCQSTATASNQIVLQDIICKTMSSATKAQTLADLTASGEPITESRRSRLEISDIEQQAVAQLYMTCVFDQKNVSEIVNNITNKISKKYNQIYDAVQKKGAEKGPDWLNEKMKLVDLLAAAGTEKIIAAAGNLPSAIPSTSSAPANTTVVTQDGSNSGGTTTDVLPIIGPPPTPPTPPTPPITPPPTTTPRTTVPPTTPPTTTAPPTTAPPTQQPNSTTQPTDTKSSPIIPEQSQMDSLLANPYFLYGGIALFVIIIFLIIVMATSGSSSNNSSSDEDESD